MGGQRVAYYYKEDVGHHYYGPSHPMKPIRMKLAHHLILTYGLYRKMECYVSYLRFAAVFVHTNTHITEIYACVKRDWDD